MLSVVMRANPIWKCDTGNNFKQVVHFFANFLSIYASKGHGSERTEKMRRHERTACPFHSRVGNTNVCKHF